MIGPPPSPPAGRVPPRPVSLRLYDPAVFGLSDRLLWECPTQAVIAHAGRHVSGDHLDVGVGTGWFLDRVAFPQPPSRLVLLDREPRCLAAAATRLARHRPRLYCGDVLTGLSLGEAPFRSIGMTYLLHCLPGNIAAKAVAFDRLLPWLAPGGTLFGATILGRGVPISRPARVLAAFHNRFGLFFNAEDNLTDLEAALRRRFVEVEITRRGCVALFAARRSPDDRPASR